MHDGSTDFEIEPPSTIISDQFGELVEGEAFVEHEYEPADPYTREFVDCLLKELSLPHGKGALNQKYVRCLSDALVAIRTTRNGLFCWPMRNANFVGEAYGADVARKVRYALMAAGKMWLHQKASKNDKLARIYEADKSFVPADLRFKCHGAGRPVIVRNKYIKRGKKTYGGERLPRKKFLPEIVKLERQVQAINDFHKNHPLLLPNGEERARCRRIFNNGSLTVGGRLYGPWQQMGEDERLACTIDGEGLCEIDLKASYLSIAHAIIVGSGDLGFDPYAKVKCVRETNFSARREQLRGLIKLLVVTYVSQSLHHPEKEALAKYPNGKRIKDEIADEARTVSVKKQFEVTETVQFYKEQILDQFPFLIKIRECPYDVMFMESEIMLTAIDNLTKKGMPAYPVHDCLLVKFSDKEAALEELIQSQKLHLGRSIHMDCSYFDEWGSKVEEPLTKEVSVDDAFEALFKPVRIDWGIDDDFEVIELTGNQYS